MKAFSATIIRERAIQISKATSPTEFSDGLWGAIIGIFDSVFYKVNSTVEPTREDRAYAKQYAETSRYLVFGYLFTDKGQSYKKLQSKDLTPQEKNAVYQWMKPEKDEKSGRWKASRLEWYTEVIWLHGRAMMASAMTQHSKYKDFGDILAAQEEMYNGLSIDGEAGGMLFAGINLGGDVLTNKEGAPGVFLEKKLAGEANSYEKQVFNGDSEKEMLELEKNLKKNLETYIDKGTEEFIKEEQAWAETGKPPKDEEKKERDILKEMGF